MIIVIESNSDGVDIWSNSDKACFNEMMSTFLQLPWKGRVPANEVWGEWQYFYNTQEDAEVYALDLEDGKIQMSILNITIKEAQKKLNE